MTEKVILASPWGGTEMASHCTLSALFPVNLLRGPAAGAVEEGPSSMEMISCQCERVCVCVCVCVCVGREKEGEVVNCVSVSKATTYQTTNWESI